MGLLNLCSLFYCLKAISEKLLFILYNFIIYSFVCLCRDCVAAKKQIAKLTNAKMNAELKRDRAEEEMREMRIQLEQLQKRMMAVDDVYLAPGAGAGGISADRSIPSGVRGKRLDELDSQTSGEKEEGQVVNPFLPPQPKKEGYSNEQGAGRALLEDHTLDMLDELDSLGEQHLRERAKMMERETKQEAYERRLREREEFERERREADLLRQKQQREQKEKEQREVEQRQRVELERQLRERERLRNQEEVQKRAEEASRREVAEREGEAAKKARAAFSVDSGKTNYVDSQKDFQKFIVRIEKLQATFYNRLGLS